MTKKPPNHSAGDPVGARPREVVRPEDLDAAQCECEVRAQKYLDLPGVIFLELDGEGGVAAINANGLKALGYHRDELIGKCWFTTCLPDLLRGEVIKVHRRLMRGEVEPTSSFDNPVVRKDGTERIVSWHNTVMRNAEGEITGTLSAGEDITERIVMQERLREAYDIINRSPAATFLWKNQPGWPVAFVSENVSDIFGFTSEEFMRGEVSYKDVIHPDDLDRVTREVREYSLEQGRERFSHEPYRIIAKDQEIKWVEDRTFIRRNDRGAISHYQGIVQDISLRKAAEDELLRERDRLREALAEVKALSGLLPICANCKKIRDDQGYWERIESYFQSHADVQFSHGICPDCMETLYSELDLEDPDDLE